MREANVLANSKRTDEPLNHAGRTKQMSLNRRNVHDSTSPCRLSTKQTSSEESIHRHLRERTLSRINKEKLLIPFMYKILRRNSQCFSLQLVVMKPYRILAMRRGMNRHSINPLSSMALVLIQLFNCCEIKIFARFVLFVKQRSLQRGKKPNWHLFRNNGITKKRQPLLRSCVFSASKLMSLSWERTRA